MYSTPPEHDPLPPLITGAAVSGPQQTLPPPSAYAIWYPGPTDKHGKPLGAPTLALDPTPPQRQFLLSETPMLLAWGNRGGGKSIIARWKCHLRAMAHPGFRYAVLRRTLAELKNSVIADGLELELKRLGGTYNRTDNVARYPKGSTGLFIGIDDPEAMMRLLGGQYGLLWFEELSLFDEWSTVTRVLSCLRTLKTDPFKGQMIATSNPFGPLEDEVFHRWIAKDVDREVEPDYDRAEYEAVEMQRRTNSYLDIEPYEKVLRREVNPALRAAWLDGTWGNSSGSFFSFKPTAADGQDWHVLARLPEISGRSIFRHPTIPVYRAVDWGFADDPAVCLWVVVLPNGRAIVIKEMDWRRTPVVEVSAEIIGHSTDMQIAQTFCDPSMFNSARLDRDTVSVGDVFEMHGVPLTKSINDRRVYSVHEYLSVTIDNRPKLQIWAENCPKLIESFKKQRSKSRDPERMADSRTDHHVLALSYFCSGGIAGHDAPEMPKVPWWILKQQQLNSSKPLGNFAVRNR